MTAVNPSWTWNWTPKRPDLTPPSHYAQALRARAHPYSWGQKLTSRTRGQHDAGAGAGDALNLAAASQLPAEPQCLRLPVPSTKPQREASLDLKDYLQRLSAPCSAEPDHGIFLARLKTAWDGLPAPGLAKPSVLWAILDLSSFLCRFRDRRLIQDLRSVGLGAAEASAVNNLLR